MAKVMQRTLNQLMGDHLAVIERDQGTVDPYGGGAAANWQTHLTVPCAMWFQRQSSRGPAREVYTPESTVAIDDGGAMLPPDTDVTAADRIARFTEKDGTMIDGPFDISAVLPQGQFVEIAFRRL